MQPARRGGLARPVIATVLVLIALASFGVWRVLSGTADLPYDTSASPPETAQVTADQTYSLAVPGGVRALIARGVPVVVTNGNQAISLNCTYTSAQDQNQALSVSTESTDTKAENVVAHFVAPLTGAIHVDCARWGAMFIPDSNDRPADYAGWALVVGVITLAIGASLAVSAIRLAWERGRASRSAGEDDEVEGFVDVAPAGRDDREVGGGDRDDVGP